MSKLTQGTEIYFLDDQGSDPVVVKVQCPTAFNPGGNPADQLDDTCLDAVSRAYKSGLRTPGQASLNINADPENESHTRMHEFSEMNPSPELKWAVGWSDGTAAPTVNSVGDDFNLPATRTWFTFQGYISDFPFDFQGNSLVASAVSIQRSGGAAWIEKAS